MKHQLHFNLLNTPDSVFLDWVGKVGRFNSEMWVAIKCFSYFDFGFHFLISQAKEVKTKDKKNLSDLFLFFSYRQLTKNQARWTFRAITQYDKNNKCVGAANVCLWSVT